LVNVVIAHENLQTMFLLCVRDSPKVERGAARRAGAYIIRRSGGTRQPRARFAARPSSSTETPSTRRACSLDPQASEAVIAGDRRNYLLVGLIKEAHKLSLMAKSHFCPYLNSGKSAISGSFEAAALRERLNISRASRAGLKPNAVQFLRRASALARNLIAKHVTSEYVSLQVARVLCVSSRSRLRTGQLSDHRPPGQHLI
jgi:hypothetical protein